MRTALILGCVKSTQLSQFANMYGGNSVCLMQFRPVRNCCVPTMDHSMGMHSKYRIWLFSCFFMHAAYLFKLTS